MSGRLAEGASGDAGTRLDEASSKTGADVRGVLGIRQHKELRSTSSEFLTHLTISVQ